jgi:hypothetical protein
VAVIILVVSAVVLAIVAYALVSGIIGGTTSAVNIDYQNSKIIVDASSGSGTFYLTLHNYGPSSASVLAVYVKNDDDATYGVGFSYNSGNPVSIDFCSSLLTCTYVGSATWAGSNGVGIVQLITSDPNTGKLVIPAGGSVSVTVTFSPAVYADITQNFTIGKTYHGFIKLSSGKESQIDYLHLINEGYIGPTMTGLEIPIQIPAVSI